MFASSVTLLLSASIDPSDMRTDKISYYTMLRYT